jgi:hypothetical protein
MNRRVKRYSRVKGETERETKVSAVPVQYLVTVVVLERQEERSN